MTNLNWINNSTWIKNRQQTQEGILSDNTSDTVNDILTKKDIDNVFDLEILSSKEYILTQFNFLKVVWEFIDFLETDDGKLTDIKQQFKDIISDFLWEDYKKLIDFFAKNPIDSEIEVDKLEKIVNKTANEIDFAKLSFISPIIEKLNEELNNFKEENDRTMALINTILKIEQIFNNSIWKLAKKVYKKKDTSKPENLLYSLEHNYWNEVDEEWKIIREYQNYTFIREYLDSITWHAWIVPLLIQKWIIQKSGLLNKNERIKTIRPKNILLPWNDITIEKTWNKITIKDSETWKVYSESKIKKEIYKTKSPSKEWIELWAEIGEYKEDMIMHDEFWHHKFSKEVPLELCDDRLMPLDSWLLEHIWFRLLNDLFLNEENIKNLKEMMNNEKLNNMDFAKLKKIFASIDEVYLNPDFKRLIKENRTPIINITSAKPARWPVKFDIEVLTNDKEKLIWEYRIMIA